MIFKFWQQSGNSLFQRHHKIRMIDVEQAEQNGVCCNTSEGICFHTEFLLSVRVWRFYGDLGFTSWSVWDRPNCPNAWIDLGSNFFRFFSILTEIAWDYWKAKNSSQKNVYSVLICWLRIKRITFKKKSFFFFPPRYTLT